MIKQQLKWKLKLLNDMDSEILDHCEVDTIKDEIEESELVIAWIINCNQQTDKAVTPITSRATVAPQEAPAVKKAKP